MFDKVKNLYNLQKVQGEMKKEAEKIFHNHEEKGMVVLIRGDYHIEKVEVDGNEDKRIKEVMNNALKEIQKKMAKKMQGQLSELGIPGL